MAVDELALCPGQRGFQRFAEAGLIQCVQPRLAVEGRHEPAAQGLTQCRVGHIGQVQFRHPRAQRHAAGLPLAQPLGPRQRVDAQLGHRLGQRLRGLRRIDAAGRTAVEHDTVEAAFAARDQGAFAGIPAHHVLLLEALGEIAAQAVLIHRCGAQQQRVARFVAQLHRDQPRFATQVAGIEQARTAPVGQQVAQRVGGVACGDAVGEGVGEQVAELVRLHRGGRAGIAAQASSPLLAGRIDGGQPAAVGVVGHAPLAESGQGAPAGGQGIAALAQRIARLHQRGQVAGQRLFRPRRGRQQHGRQPRMGPQGEHPPAERGQPAAVAQGAQPLQQLARGGQCAHRRRVHEAQVIAAPGRQLQRQRGQLHLGDFGAALGLQPLRLRPQAPRPAFGHAAGAAGALVGRGLGDAHHVEPGEAAVGVVARLARQPGIDHHAHAGQGHRGFGHVGGQHHPALAIRIRLQHPRLLLHRQFAMQRQHLHAGRHGLRQRGLGARDLALAGQEHQHVAGMVGQGLLHRAPCLRFQRFLAPCREVADRHRVAAPFAAQPRRIQEPCQPLAVQRGRHHHDAQVLAQLCLHIQRQGQAQVRRQMAFVEFIEQQCPHAIQHWIILQHPGQDAFGDHFHAGAGRYLVLETDAVADRVAHRLAPLPRHELRGAARGYPARLQHDDPAALQPGRIEQGQGHLGGLARAGWRLQHEARVCLQSGQDARQQRGNRENRRTHRPRIRPPLRLALPAPGRRGSLCRPGSAVGRCSMLRVCCCCGLPVRVPRCPRAPPNLPMPARRWTRPTMATTGPCWCAPGSRRATCRWA
ncbi:hypothetical protein D3C71_1014760 [compost metagenome]